MIRPTRLSIVHGVLVAFALALIGRAAKVQLFDGAKWNAAAERQHYAQTSLDAPRGVIEDAAGFTLARNQDLVRIAIAPPEVKDMRELQRALTRLGVERELVRRATDRKRKWVELKDAYSPDKVAALARIPGVHATAVGQRLYVVSDGVRRLLGRTDAAGKGVDGLELALDSLLLGTKGQTAAFRGAKGERYESPEVMTSPARPGHTVRLTISYALQDICDRALADATLRLRADGGDIVVIDPRSGAVRCLASRRAGSRSTALTAVTEPYEPGSTLKPFFTGTLLEAGLAKPTDVVETFGGKLTIAGRTISDVHKAERLSLADVIRFSSNVGIARFAERLSDRQVFETLRDYGFGTPTGVPYPSEAPGILREPRRWSKQSHVSLAIGYEVSVTPLQLATAYAALANGGTLLQPALVASITDPDGKMIYEQRPRVVRQVLKPETAETLREILESVVDSGTATDASLTSFDLAGKSGTARRNTGGRYGAGLYTSSFVGIFPSRDPQYVVLVKVDNPRGTYYGGKTAAPVAKAVIEAAIASHGAALDTRTLASQRLPYTPPPVAPDTTASKRVAVVAEDPIDSAISAATAAADVVPDVPLVDSTPEPPRREVVRFEVSRPIKDAARADTMVVVPLVRGLPLRVAVRELHRAGLRVALGGAGDGATSPPAGTRVRVGSLVRLSHS